MSGPETVVRKANLADVPQLKQCIDRAYARLKIRLPDLPDVSGGLEQEIDKRTVLIAEVSGGIAGCAVLGIDGPGAHLVNIAVDPGFKGQGIGRSLMQAAETHARHAGATEIALATHVGIPENVALYQHLGWSETSRNSHKVFMKKKL
ncbi:GNAT family N-acetyltransferase [Roseibium sp. MMSF_3412]|uniref:GNAT family N-acetyltransferase n=1 Tax=Roseibium sp. MMSF_3412 TaxID=3046712 RepID=UPI00273D7765|nr:GNAT family N-acetyltransferase [Roseibium sp. MMSF_3412]